jgi:hypothetical protein
LLEQIEQRLQALYGAAASFVAAADPGAATGGTARIALPLERAGADAAAVPA